MRAHAGNQRLNHRWALGGLTRHLPGGRTVSIVDAATCWAGEDVPLIILASVEDGSIGQTSSA